MLSDTVIICHPFFEEVKASLRHTPSSVTFLRFLGGSSVNPTINTSSSSHPGTTTCLKLRHHSKIWSCSGTGIDVNLLKCLVSMKFGFLGFINKWTENIVFFVACQKGNPHLKNVSLAPSSDSFNALHYPSNIFHVPCGMVSGLNVAVVAYGESLWREGGS